MPATVNSPAHGHASTPYRPHFTRKGEATRARIVEIAADLIFERGVAGTRMEDVREAAQVSASQLYHYFGDKEGLVRAVIAQQTEAVLSSQQPFLDQLDSFEALNAWRDMMVSMQVDRQCRGGCSIGSLASQLAETQPDARRDLAEAFDRWSDPIRRGLAAMRDRGELCADADPGQLSLALLASLQGGILMTQTMRHPGPLRAALDSAIAHIHTFAVAA